MHNSINISNVVPGSDSFRRVEACSGGYRHVVAVTGGWM